MSIRSPILLFALALGLAGTTGARGAVPTGTVVEEGFETEPSGWTVGTHLPDDPDTGEPVAYEAMADSLMVHSGQRAMRLTLDGRQDDGTLWLAWPLGTLEENERRRVTLDFQFFSEFGDSFNNLAYAVAYVGAGRPEVEQDFHRVAPVNEIDRWQGLTRSATVEGAAGDTVWVAVGFSVVWESEQTYFIDDVTVEVDDPPTAVEASSWGRLKGARR